MKIPPPKKKWGAQNFRFLSESLDSVVFGQPLRGNQEARRNPGKNKLVYITTISRLPSHTRLVKFGSGEFEL